MVLLYSGLYVCSLLHLMLAIKPVQ